MVINNMSKREKMAVEKVNNTRKRTHTTNTKVREVCLKWTHSFLKSSLSTRRKVQGPNLFNPREFKKLVRTKSRRKSSRASLSTASRQKKAQLRSSSTSLFWESSLE